MTKVGPHILRAMGFCVCILAPVAHEVSPWVQKGPHMHGPSVKGHQVTAATASPGAARMDGETHTSPKLVKFLFGDLVVMGSTVFVQPLHLVKNPMQLSGGRS